MLLRFIIAISACALLSSSDAKSHKSSKQSINQSINQSITDFTCDNGTVRLSINQLNDNYCDCLHDGSDESLTGACVKGRFQCFNQFYLSRNVSSSFVRDGICDCCDGSDESINQSITEESINHSINPCPNTCYEKGQKWLSEQSEQLRLYEEGVSIRQSMKQSIKRSIDQSINQLTSSLPMYRERLASIEQQYDQLIDQLNKVSNQHLGKYTNDQSINQFHQQISQAQNTYSAYHREYERIQGMIGIEEFVRNQSTSESPVFDHRKVPSQLIDSRYLSLFDRCFDYHTYQRRYDEHGVQIDSYLIMLCPLKNITQIKLTDIEKELNISNQQLDNQALTQRSRQLLDRLIDAKIDVPTTVLGHFESVIRTHEMYQLQLKLEAAAKRQSIATSPNQSVKQSPKDLQHYENQQSIIQAKQQRILSFANNGSYPLNSYRTGPPVFYLRFSGGARCYGSTSADQSRQAIVRVTCGLTDRLIDFEENGLCQYELKFESPIACIPSFAKQWEKAIHQFQQQWQKDKHEEL